MLTLREVGCCQPLTAWVLLVSIISVTSAPSTISNEKYRECWHKWPFVLLNQSMSSTRVYSTFSLFNDKYKNITCWPFMSYPKRTDAIVESLRTFSLLHTGELAASTWQVEWRQLNSKCVGNFQQHLSFVTDGPNIRHVWYWFYVLRMKDIV